MSNSVMSPEPNTLTTSAGSKKALTTCLLPASRLSKKQPAPSINKTSCSVNTPKKCSASGVDKATRSINGLKSSTESSVVKERHVSVTLNNEKMSITSNKCPLCSKIEEFQFKSYLVRHIAAKHEKSFITIGPFRSYLCKIQLCNKSKYLAHYHCPVCPFSCRVKNKLPSHYETHITNIEPSDAGDTVAEK